MFETRVPRRNCALDDETSSSFRVNAPQGQCASRRTHCHRDTCSSLPDRRPAASRAPSEPFCQRYSSSSGSSVAATDRKAAACHSGVRRAEPFTAFSRLGPVGTESPRGHRRDSVSALRCWGARQSRAASEHVDDPTGRRRAQHGHQQAGSQDDVLPAPIPRYWPRGLARHRAIQGAAHG
jgi:hypothetical protein